MNPLLIAFSVIQGHRERLCETKSSCKAARFRWCWRHRNLKESFPFVFRRAWWGRHRDFMEFWTLNNGSIYTRGLTNCFVWMGDWRIYSWQTNKLFHNFIKCWLSQMGLQSESENLDWNQFKFFAEIFMSWIVSQ